jgi:hypothetical protein
MIPFDLNAEIRLSCRVCYSEYTKIRGTVAMLLSFDKDALMHVKRKDLAMKGFCVATNSELTLSAILALF